MSKLEEKMAETYYRRITRERDPITIDDVPAKVRPYVEKLLEKQNAKE